MTHREVSCAHLSPEHALHPRRGSISNGKIKIALEQSTVARSPSASSQPRARTPTIRAYRGNKITFTYAIPASSFVAGTNTLTISPISGSSDLDIWRSASYAFDCIELDN